MYKYIVFILFISYCVPGICQDKTPDDKLDPFYSVKAPEKFKNGKLAFENVMKIVSSQYYDSKGITEDDLYYAAIKGILRRISPPKTPTQGKIWSRAEKSAAMNSLKTQQLFAGFKYEFSSIEGSLRVLSIEQGSPADGFLKVNDLVKRINDKELKGKSSSQISEMLKGEKGTEIKLKVVRDIEVLDATLKLKTFKRKYCKGQIIKDTGYVRLKSFSENASDEIKEHLEKFKSTGCKSVILDLRQNTGGYFTQAIKTAELFLKKRSRILSVVRSSKRTDYQSFNQSPFDFKVAVLIDRYSASSSEIVASALKENKRAILIGSNSYGKAITEKTFDINNNFYIKFTVGAMYDIKKGNWHESGLTPDIAVDGKIHENPEEDSVVTKAIEYLKKK